MPVRNKPYEREIEGGTAVKLYEYDMKGFRSHVLMRGRAAISPRIALAEYSSSGSSTRVPYVPRRRSAQF